MSGLSSMMPSAVDFDSPNLGKDWKTFKQQLNFYLAGKELSEAEDVVKVGTLMTCLGKKGIDMFNALGLDDSTSYADVIKKFDEHCGLKKNSVYERFLFNKMYSKRVKVLIRYYLSSSHKLPIVISMTRKGKT